MVPYMIVGMKKDKKDKYKVQREEQHSLMSVLKKYMKCDHTMASQENPEDIA